MIRLASLIVLVCAVFASAADKPNVIIVITDDQGYGDIAAHGNDVIQTPNLDKLHAQSVRLTDFHVDPTCSPTRSALMSGRYSTRTGVWHTIMGRSMMAADELTIAEMLRAGGYVTGMYGKWHLGDNYPLRPQDQGFDEVFYHGGGGVTQTPDHFDNDYFDDIYYRATLGKAGVPEKTTGYCTDVWFDNALAFVDKQRKSDKPFFVYLSTNAPHGPFLVADKYKQIYESKGVKGATAAFWGMITNIDENMGRLMARLDEWGVAENTILIFMTDNGTAAGKFNAEMKGHKGSEYDGGHRVPFFVRWPGGGIHGGRDVNVLTAHIDVLPTLAALCGVMKPDGPPIDGVSIAPLLTARATTLPQPRTLFVHSQRVEHVQKGRKNAVMTDRWRLVNNKELYDIEADPGQKNNIASANPQIVKRLNDAYDAWWESLSPVFDEYVRIGLGADGENPAHLTCHDWHTNNKSVPWHQNHIRKGEMSNGYWAVDVTQAGRYEITLRRWPHYAPDAIEATKAQLEIAGVDQTKDCDPKAKAVSFTVELPAGPTKMTTTLTLPDGKTRGAYFVDVRRVE